VVSNILILWVSENSCGFLWILKNFDGIEFFGKYHISSPHFLYKKIGRRYSIIFQKGRNC
jgi:hypothetical protein